VASPDLCALCLNLDSPQISRNHDFVVLEETGFKGRIKTTDSSLVRECNIDCRSAHAKFFSHSA